MRIGLIGVGHVGGTIAKLAVEHGHEVVLSNSRGAGTLVAMARDLGGRAVAGTSVEAARAGEIVVVAIPLRAYVNVPVAELAAKTVIDANNYYPQRDGHIPELDDGTKTSSELLATHLREANVVKAFNSIGAADLASQGQRAGTPGRRALPIAGDNADAKRTVEGLIDEFGFDVVDAGPLVEGRRFQPGMPASLTRLDIDGLRAALAQS